MTKSPANDGLWTRPRVEFVLTILGAVAVLASFNYFLFQTQKGSMITELSRHVPDHSHMAQELDLDNSDLTKVIERVADDPKLLQKLRASIASVPIGTVVAYSGKIQSGQLIDGPNGQWMLCDGRALSKDGYEELRDRIGQKYGEGKPKGQEPLGYFNLPDYIGHNFSGADPKNGWPVGKLRPQSKPRLLVQSISDAVGNVTVDHTRLVAVKETSLEPEQTGKPLPEREVADQLTSIWVGSASSPSTTVSKEILSLGMTKEPIRPESWTVNWIIRVK